MTGVAPSQQQKRLKLKSSPIAMVDHISAKNRCDARVASKSTIFDSAQMPEANDIHVSNESQITEADIRIGTMLVSHVKLAHSRDVDRAAT